MVIIRIDFEKEKYVMPFIGIIADEKNENFIRREIVNNLNLRESNVLFIKEKSIENIKNIKFETIILARKFKNMEMLKKILINAKYLIINTDRIKNIDMFKELKLKIITFGFNLNATVSASSVSQDSSLICVEREIETIKNRIIERQEIKIDAEEDVESIMAVVTIFLLYDINNK